MGKCMRIGPAVVVALAALAGCATNYRPTPYWQIHETAFAQLVPGVTTKDQVRDSVGVPLVEYHFWRLNEDVWQYRYLEGVATVMLAWLSFDPNGVFKSGFYQLDPAYTGGDRGR
jgi:outer membrane protein assembly factor BamE (lipoprotein component of BamABCDE complex)